MADLIIDPFSTSSAPPSSPDDPTPSAPPAGPSLFTSTVSTSSANLDDLPTLSIIGFSRAVGDPNDLLNDTIYASQAFNANNRNELYNSIASDALDVGQKIAKLLDLNIKVSRAINSNQDYVDTVNTAIDAYNGSGQITSDNTAINAMNAAIDTYNAADKSTPALLLAAQTVYFTAVGVYNSYVSTRNGSSTYTNFTGAISTFNTQVATNNVAITEANTILAGYGFPPIPLQATYTGTLNTMTALSTTVVQTTHIGSSTNPIDVLNTIGTPASATKTIQIAVLFIFLTFLLGGASIYQLASNQSDYLAALQFKLLGSIATLPDGFILPDPDVASPSTSTDNSSSGSGVGIVSIAADLNNPSATAIIDQSLYTGAINTQNQVVDPQILTQFSLLFSSVLANLSIPAGITATRLLANVLPYLDPLSSPVLAAVGTGTLSEINLAVASGLLKDPILAILTQAYPNVSANTLNELAQQLASSYELILLFVGLSQLGQTLNNPQLFGQVIATLNAAQTLGATTPSQTTADVLSDNARVDDLKSTLTASVIAQGNLSSDQNAAAIVNTAVNNALANQDAINSGAVGQAITNELINQGVIQSDAIAAGNLANSEIQSEITGGDILNQSISDANLSQEILSNNLVQSLLQNNEITTVRQLRDALAAEFAKSNGVTQGEALQAATIAVTGQQPPVTPQSIEDLRTNLYNQAIAQLAGLDQNTAASIAQEIVNTVIGNGQEAVDSVSFTTLAQDRLQSLLSTNNEQLNQTIVDNLNDSLNTTLNLWDLGNWARDPANTYVQVGIMNSQTEPSGFKKTVSMIV